MSTYVVQMLMRVLPRQLRSDIPRPDYIYVRVSHPDVAMTFPTQFLGASSLLIMNNKEVDYR